MITLDMRSKICPFPVIETKKVLDKADFNETVIVTVDNIVATENLEKFCKEKGFSDGFSVTKNSDTEFLVTIIKGDGNSEILEEQIDVPNNFSSHIIVISSDEMGEGSPELSKKLLEGFIYSLTEQEYLPKEIIFYNKGVYLTTINKKTVDDLLFLQNKGVKIYSCGLCLDFYDLKETLLVGEVTNMYSITSKMLSNNVINIS